MDLENIKNKYGNILFISWFVGLCLLCGFLFGGV